MEQRKLPETRHNKKILFIAAQAGQASYLNPLWDKWLQNKPEHIQFKIWASPDARRLIKSELNRFCVPWEEHKVMQTFMPDIIISSACGEDREIDASNYAHQNNRKHIQFIDTFYDCKKRIDASNSKDVNPHEIWLIHDYAYEQAKVDGIDPELIKVVGHPYFENIYQSKMPDSKASNALIFVAQPISQIKGLKEELGYDEKCVWHYLQKAKMARPDLIDELIYAPHPAQKNLPEMSEGERILLTRETIEDVRGTLIGMFSAALIENIIRGRRIISVQPNLKCKNKDILSSKNFIPLITSNIKEDLIDAIVDEKGIKGEKFSKSFANSMQKIERRIFKII